MDLVIWDSSSYYIYFMGVLLILATKPSFGPFCNDYLLTPELPEDLSTIANRGYKKQG